MVDVSGLDEAGGGDWLKYLRLVSMVPNENVLMNLF